MDSRFISIFMISFLSGTYQVFINMNLKIIYMPIVNDDRFLVYCAMIGTAVSIFGAFIWGYVGDKYGFLSSLFVFTVIDCVIKIYGTFAVTKPTIMILFILIGCTDKAMLTIMGPGLVKMFGIEIATELLPYKGFSVFLSFLLAPIGYLLLSDVVSPFKYLMIIVICSVISVILSIRLYSQRKIKWKMIYINNISVFIHEQSCQKSKVFRTITKLKNTRTRTSLRIKSIFSYGFRFFIKNSLWVSLRLLIFLYGIGGGKFLSDTGKLASYYISVFFLSTSDWSFFLRIWSNIAVTFLIHA